MTLSEIQAALQDRRLRRVAEATGLHYNTVRAIASGTNTNPSLSTMQALEVYLVKTCAPAHAGGGGRA